MCFLVPKIIHTTPSYQTYTLDCVIQFHSLAFFEGNGGRVGCRAIAFPSAIFFYNYQLIVRGNRAPSPLLGKPIFASPFSRVDLPRCPNCIYSLQFLIHSQSRIVLRHSVHTKAAAETHGRAHSLHNQTNHLNSHLWLNPSCSQHHNHFFPYSLSTYFFSRTLPNAFTKH